MTEQRLRVSTGYQAISAVREKLPALALATGIVVTAAACGGEPETEPTNEAADVVVEDVDPSEDSTTASLSEEEIQSTAPKSSAAQLRGDGETEEFIFDYLDVGSDDVLVYADPFESGRGPASFTYNDGEKFYGDCTTIGRLIVSPNHQIQADSDVWVLGETQGGDRAFASAVLLEGGPEYARQKLEDCQ